jgi:hypothetical protein
MVPKKNNKSVVPTWASRLCCRKGESPEREKVLGSCWPSMSQVLLMSIFVAVVGSFTKQKGCN